MNRPPDTPPASTSSGLRLRPAASRLSPVATNTPATVTHPTATPSSQHTGNIKSRRAIPQSAGAAWLVFMLVGGVMAAGRYGDWWPWPTTISAAYALHAVLILHLLVIGLAFQDDWFAGLLCIVVPGYSLFWLLARSGRPLLCALILGLLVGLGQDAVSALAEHWEQFRLVVEDVLGQRRN